MDVLQQRILEIALQIPEYVGYAAKERRRDVDRHLRRQLAAKYDAQRTRLARAQQRAGMDYVVQIEQLDQKLLRLIAQFQTAPRGYAGWFDSAQIGDGDLDQLTKFDADLSDGVNALATKLDQLANALKQKTDLQDAIDACSDTLDALNAEFDQRDEFVAQGKKPSIAMPALARVSPLDALDAKKTPSREITALANLKLNDAVTFEGTDYLVAGKITFTARGATFFAFLLADGARKNWLRVGPNDAIGWCDEIALRVPTPPPDSLEYDKQSFTRVESGTANANVVGASGSKRGSVNYARYTGELGSVLWAEDYGAETRVMLGRAIDATEIQVYRR
ncbi:MAG: DUF4178 domain-containing protein [Chloroflexi bacterium]|nr:DUF4178 domain-containing protein [Chloroflexota bacterium]